MLLVAYRIGCTVWFFFSPFSRSHVFAGMPNVPNYAGPVKRSVKRCAAASADTLDTALDTSRRQLCSRAVCMKQLITQSIIYVCSGARAHTAITGSRTRIGKSAPSEQPDGRSRPANVSSSTIAIHTCINSQLPRVRVFCITHFMHVRTQTYYTHCVLCIINAFQMHRSGRALCVRLCGSAQTESVHKSCH